MCLLVTLVTLVLRLETSAESILLRPELSLKRSGKKPVAPLETFFLTKMNERDTSDKDYVTENN